MYFCEVVMLFATKMNPPGDLKWSNWIFQHSWTSHAVNKHINLFSGMLSFQIHTFIYVYIYISLIHLNKIHLAIQISGIENRSNLFSCWQRFLGGIGSYGCDNSCILTGLLLGSVPWSSSTVLLVVTGGARASLIDTMWRETCFENYK